MSPIPEAEVLRCPDGSWLACPPVGGAVRCRTQADAMDAHGELIAAYNFALEMAADASAPPELDGVGRKRRIVSMLQGTHPAPTPVGAGRKDDHEKPRSELIAPELIEGLGEVLAYGAKKYSNRNWERGMEWSRPFGALMRHMWAWWRGEGVDEETGKSHLLHAACCLMFLIAYEARGMPGDDRHSV